jgi:hypothetical protein
MSDYGLAVGRYLKSKKTGSRSAEASSGVAGISSSTVSSSGEISITQLIKVNTFVERDGKLISNVVKASAQSQCHALRFPFRWLEERNREYRFRMVSLDVESFQNQLTDDGMNRLARDGDNELDILVGSRFFQICRHLKVFKDRSLLQSFILGEYGWSKGLCLDHFQSRGSSLASLYRSGSEEDIREALADALNGFEAMMCFVFDPKAYQMFRGLREELRGIAFLELSLDDSWADHECTSIRQQDPRGIYLGLQERLFEVMHNVRDTISTLRFPLNSVGHCLEYL